MYKKKVNIPMMSALCLLLLTLISFHFTSGLYARYTSTVVTTDTARVAAFRIETDLDYVTMGMDANVIPDFELGGTAEVDSIQIPFYVQSRSEVTVAYSVDVDFGVALPDFVSLTLSNGREERTVAADGTTSLFSFTDFASMGVGADTSQKDQLVLTIRVDDVTQIQTELSVPGAELIVRVYQTD